MSTALPVPTTLYPDWARFIAAAWVHGRAHPRPDAVRDYVNEGVLKALQDAVLREDEPLTIRPSSLLSCPRQAWLLAQGHRPLGMTRGIGVTFSVGHLLHAFSYAFLSSALPPGFTMSVEDSVALPSWWPRGNPLFRDRGTRDLLISVTDPDAAGRYIKAPVRPRCVVDFKSAGSVNARNYAKKDLSEVADGFGYLPQISLYAEEDRDNTEAVLAVINRDTLMAPLVARAVTPFVREKAVRLAQACVEAAVAPGAPDPARWFLDTWGEDGGFYCGTNGREGYCPMREACASTATPEEVENLAV